MCHRLLAVHEAVFAAEFEGQDLVTGAITSFITIQCTLRAEPSRSLATMGSSGARPTSSGLYIRCLEGVGKVIPRLSCSSHRSAGPRRSDRTRSPGPRRTTMAAAEAGDLKDVSGPLASTRCHRKGSRPRWQSAADCRKNPVVPRNLSTRSAVVQPATMISHEQQLEMLERFASESCLSSIRRRPPRCGAMPPPTAAAQWPMPPRSLRAQGLKRLPAPPKRFNPVPELSQNRCCGDRCRQRCSVRPEGATGHSAANR